MMYIHKGLGEKLTLFAQDVCPFLPDSGKLLELGAGLGQDSCFFASHRFDVVATDLVDTSIMCEGVSFQVLDISKPFGFSDNEFDVVYAHLSLHYFTETATRAVFKEIHRVLRDGGVFAFLVNTIRDPEIKDFGYKEVEPFLYDNGLGILKRYFSVESVRSFISGMFDPVMLDEQGRTYKDDIDTLIRFVGKNI